MNKEQVKAKLKAHGFTCSMYTGDGTQERYTDDSHVSVDVCYTTSTYTVSGMVGVCEVKYPTMGLAFLNGEAQAFTLAVSRMNRIVTSRVARNMANELL